MVRTISDIQTWNETVDSVRYVLINFTARWCDPCQRIDAKFIELAEKTKYLDLIQVDVDQNGEAAEVADIAVMPTFQIWKDGLMIEKFEGADDEKLMALVEKYETIST
eukprot:CAMPEP_0119333554 /NCGR_PEP_ID=MMETSP1333-20130426/85412_1 /TAXON_ID=418940 /ORGANISM="Scyphosphaera apsteinii, Strain RCC1455" /LENGTH=107 /DNA_ID=CAMNT_0007343647 /DNA_START=45 /DNA_END=365 /DNA_ORIENTATION=-